MKEALTPDEIAEVIQRLNEALRLCDHIRSDQNAEVSYETMQRSGFNRKTGWRRKYSLADARGMADSAAIQLRAAWEILDPSS
jgi:hypothetical protein